MMKQHFCTGVISSNNAHHFEQSWIYS